MFDETLLKFLGKDRKYLVFISLLGIGSFLSMVGFFACVCWAVNITTLIETPKFNILEYLGSFLMGLNCFLGYFACSFYMDKFRGTLSTKLKFNLRNSLYQKVLDLGNSIPSEFTKEKISDLVTNGVNQLDLYLGEFFPKFIVAVCVPGVLFFVTVGFSWYFALMMLVFAALLPVCVFLFDKFGYSKFSKYNAELKQMHHIFEGSVIGLETLKLYQADERQHVLMEETDAKIREKSFQVEQIKMIPSLIMNGITYLGMALGIVLVIAGAVNWGLSVSTALFLVLISLYFFEPLSQFSRIFHEGFEAVEPSKEVVKFLSLETPKWGEKELTHTMIELKNVNFGYKKDTLVLKDLDMFFPEHGLTGLLGIQKAGRTSIVNLLLGNFRPVSGEVNLGTDPINEMSKESYYSKLTIIDENSYLFNKSIRSNFLTIDRNVTDQEILEALKKVELDLIVDKIGGLSTVISDNYMLSVGQKLRLLLAMNMIAKKEIYIFDRCVDRADKESQKILMKNIRELGNTKNVILVSDNADYISSCDNIYYLEDGQVVEQGNHVSLMKERERYYTYYSAHVTK